MINVVIDEQKKVVTVQYNEETTTFFPSEKELTELVQTLHNVSYEREKDIFNLPGPVIKLGVELKVK